MQVFEQQPDPKRSQGSEASQERPDATNTQFVPEQEALAVKERLHKEGLLDARLATAETVSLDQIPDDADVTIVLRRDREPLVCFNHKGPIDPAKVNRFLRELDQLDGALKARSFPGAGGPNSLKVDAHLLNGTVVPDEERVELWIDPHFALRGIDSEISECIGSQLEKALTPCGSAQEALKHEHGKIVFLGFASAPAFIDPQELTVALKEKHGNRLKDEQLPAMVKKYASVLKKAIDETVEEIGVEVSFEPIADLRLLRHSAYQDRNDELDFDELKTEDSEKGHVKYRPMMPGIYVRTDNYREVKNRFSELLSSRRSKPSE